MGKYVNQSLREGEEVKHEAHLSFWSLISNVLLGGLCLLMSVMSMLSVTMKVSGVDVGVVVAIALMLIGVALLLDILIQYYTTELAITNRRVIAKRGWYSRDTIEMLIHKVESVQVLQPTIPRFFNYGSIIISGAGEDNATIKGISHPDSFRDHYYAAEEKLARDRPMTTSSVEKVAELL